MFPSPSRSIPSHPRVRHYRRYLEVVLLAMLRFYLLPTPRVDPYQGTSESPARMRPGDSPGPRRLFVGSGWTRTDRVEWVLLAGSARARARDIARAAPQTTGPNRAPTGAARRHGLLPPTALPCACPSVPGVSARFEMRARATNWRATAGGNPLAASGRFQRARPDACRGAPGGPAAAGPLPPVPAPVRPGDGQSGVSTPKAPSVPQNTLSVPQTGQHLV